MAEDRMLSDEILLGIINAKSGGGGGGTSNYNDLSNKPQIGGTTLTGNKSASDLGLVAAETGKGLSTNDFTDAYKTAIGDNTTAISGIKNGDEINSFGGVETALALKQDATDNSLETEAKTIVGAINEHEGDIGSLKSGLTTLDTEVNGDATTYPYADVITIEDAVPSNLADCSVKVEPVQDLHGYDKPWVGGAGKNKLPLVLADIKAANTTGTWSGNVYTVGSTTIEVMTDDSDNVIGIKINGTINSGVSFNLVNSASVPLNNSYKFFGCSGFPSGVGAITYSFDGASDINVFKNAVTSTISGTFIHAHIYLWSGNTFNNVMVYPMFMLASESDDSFAPYTNICPITGHTEASVQRDGKNWFDYSTCENKGIDDNGSTWNNSKRILSDFIAVKNHNYTVSFPSGIKFIAYANYNEQKEFVSRTLVEATEAYSFAPTTPYIKLYFSNVNTNIDISKDDVSTAQLELGSTATHYVPYAGKTYTIALGDTIYGGTVDFDSGVMTVDRALIDLGSLSWTLRSDFPIYQCADCGIDYKISNNLDNIASSFTYRGVAEGGYGVTADNSMYLYVNNRYLWIKCSSITSIEDFNDFIIGKTAVLYIDTPTTIQLTPQQIQLLKGTNTITASTGDISVTVNGVSGAIGSVQEQVNELAEDVADVTADVAELDNVVQKQTTFTTVASKWYKIGSISISSARYQLYQFIIAFNGHLIKHVKLRCVPTNGYNSQETKVEQIFGTDNSVGLIISNDYLTVDIYIKTEVAGNQSYQILTKGGEQPYAVFSTPSVTDLSDSDMSKLG